MHRLTRGLAATLSVFALTAGALAGAAPARAAGTLDIMAYEGDAGTAVIDVYNDGDAPLTNCAVAVVDDWWTTVEVLAGPVTIAPGDNPVWTGQVNLERGFYVGVVACDEDEVAQGLVAKTAEFVDVPYELSFYTEIMWMSAESISTGWPDQTYRPFEEIRRDAMAAFLYRMAGSPDFTVPADSPFSDVGVDNKYYREITWLASTGVSTGYTDGTFRPLDPVNRDAMAAFLYRYFNNVVYPGQFTWTPPATSPFSDVPTTNQFYAEIAWVAEYDISTGYSDGTYRPLASVKRDAMAAFLYRTHWLIVENQPTGQATQIPETTSVLSLADPAR